MEGQHKGTVHSSQRMLLEFDDETLQLVQDLHHAISNGAPEGTLVALRDYLWSRRQQADTRLMVLSLVARAVCKELLSAKDPSWETFFQVTSAIEQEEQHVETLDARVGAKRRRSISNSQARRLRNLATIAALWSPEVVHRYGLNRAAQTQMHIIRTCATTYPRFADFLPRWNAVRLARHCRALKLGREKSILDLPVANKDFTLAEINSAQVDKDYEMQWMRQQDGRIPIDDEGTLLREIRPQHFHLYLLERDTFGVLIAKEEDASLRAGSISSQSSPAYSTFSSDAQASSPVTDPTSGCLSDFTSADLHAPFSVASTAHKLHLCHDLSTADGDLAPDMLLTGTSNQSDITATIDPNILDFSAQTDSVSWHKLLPSNLTNQTELSTRSSMEDMMTWMFPTPHRNNNTISPSSTLGDFRQSSCGSSVIDEWSFGSPFATHSVGQHDLPHSTIMGDLTPAAPQGLRPHSRVSNQQSTRALPLMSSRVERTEGLYVEEILHNRYLEVIQPYIRQVECRAAATGTSERAKQRANWFNRKMHWATIWNCNSDSDIKGKAIDEDSAEVLYYSFEDFQRTSRSSKIPAKPIVIKEHFTDKSQHSINQFLYLLRDASRGRQLDIETIDDAATRAVSADEFVLQFNSDSDKEHGVCLADIDSITKAYHPFFTLQTQYHILDTILASVRGRPDTGGNRTTPACPDISLSTNELNAAGAFSGAQINATTGMWVRNLDGLSFWVIVPAAEMELEWARFHATAAQWAPHSKAKLIVLERDDVLFLPPGACILHAHHSPQPCLLEMGKLWDERTLLQTLESCRWATHTRSGVVACSTCPCMRVWEAVKELVEEESWRFDSDSAALQSTPSRIVDVARDLCRANRELLTAEQKHLCLFARQQ